MRLIDTPLEERHESTRSCMRWFEFEHLPSGSPQRVVSSMFHAFAHDLILSLQDGPELTLALRALEQAKNYAVHQAIIDEEREAR